MSWYAFFEKKIVGGDVYSGLESKDEKREIKMKKQITMLYPKVT